MSEGIVEFPRPELPRFIHQPAELTAQVMADLIERRAMFKSGIVPGAVTGLGRLDDLFGGYMQPGVYIIHGTPGIGKTAFALQVAASSGVPSLFVTCEMSPATLWTRVTARIAPIALRDFRSDSTGGEQLLEDALARALDGAGGLSFADARRTPLPLKLLIESISALSPRPELVVLDSLHAWALSTAGSKTEYEALNQAVDHLRELSAQFEIPVLVVAERNRASMAAGGLSAAAGTRRIEYGCDVMMELRPPEEQPKTAGNPMLPSNMVELTLRINKNRFGPPGVRLPLRLSLSLQTFMEAYA